MIIHSVVETCFGESFHLPCMSLVLEALFPSKVIVVICMKMNGFVLKMLILLKFSFLCQIYTSVLSLKLY